MTLAEDDDVIQTCSADRTDKTLSVRVLPRRSRRSDDLRDPHRSNAMTECRTIGFVSVPQRGAAAKTENQDRYNGKENRHHDRDGTAGSSKSPACPFRKFDPAWDSHRRRESSHDWGRCLQSYTRSECSWSICSSRGAGLKPRTCFSAINSALP